MNKTQTLEYNKDKGTISLCTYSDDGFLKSELDIIDKVTTLVFDKLYDDFMMYLDYWNEKYYRNGFCDVVQFIGGSFDN